MNGIFSTKPKVSKSPDKKSEVNTIKGENIKSNSVADELLKWVKMKEDGHISKEEYNDARKKLLQMN